MHSEKLVQKKATDYNINFGYIEALNDYGTRIIQEYNFRLFFIFIRYYNSYIFITCQVGKTFILNQWPKQGKHLNWE